MSQTIIEPELSRRRIRELARAHDLAWTRRARALRQSTQILAPVKEFGQRVDAPLLALLEEGVPEGQWVAASRRRCMLVEREGGELLLRSVRRKAVETAPRGASAKTVVQESTLAIRSRYRKAIAAARRISGWLCVLAVGLLGAGAVVGIATDSQSVLRAAVWCAIVFMFAFTAHMLARVTVPEPPEKELTDEHRAPSGESNTGEQTCGEAADVVPLYRGGQNARQGASTATSLMSSGDAADSSSFVHENNVYADLDMSQQEFLGYELQALPEGDLVEGFAHARALPDNDAQGSDAIRVVEARGELASILGMERGEAVLEIVWSTSGNDRSAHSYLPYREVVCGTSLDPRWRPSEKMRPECRRALHERLTAEKSLGSLEPKVTYRIGPDSYQFFGCPMWSSGEDGTYVLEDKLKYLMERAPELGFENDYDAGEWRRMQEIAATGGEYGPTHEQLLRFALIAGKDPRFFFEDSGEDLRNRTQLGSDPAQPVLWRVEAAMSEAHGLPVEVFERRLMDWRMAPYSWRFR